MIVEKIETTSRFAELREEWNSLLETSPSKCVFLTHEWLFTWWKHLGRGRSLSILTARADGKLVGILPLTLRRPQYMRMIPRCLEFLGSGVIGSDYLDAIVMPGHEQEVMRRFGDCIMQMGMILHLNQIRHDSSIVSELAKHVQKAAWTSADTKINVCPVIDLNGHNWETYLATLGSDHRYNFNRRLKNLAKNSDVFLEILQSREEAQTALDIVISLHRKRWASRGDSEAFQSEPIVAFHREFVELAAARGWLRVMVLRLDKIPVAALYGLRYGRTFYFYQSGFDPAYRKQSVGLVMTGLAIKSALQEGASEYDLLHGSEEYKFHWTRRTRDLGRIELYPCHARGRVSKHAVDLNRAARRMARRVLAFRRAS